MGSIKEEAKEYTGTMTKNIADLDIVSIDLAMEDRVGIDKQGLEFKYKVVVVEGEDYKIPGKVLGDLKSIMEKKPDLKNFSVIKKGEGLQTRYTVIQQD